MTATREEFDVCLDKGVRFELMVAAPFIREMYPDSVITEYCRMVKRNEAPCMIFRDDEMVTTDFEVRQNGQSVWIDAKWKSAWSQNVKDFEGENLLSIEPKAYRDYSKLKDTLGGDVKLLFGVDIGEGFVSSRKLFMIELEKTCTWYTYNNKHDGYGKNGKAPCYHEKDMEYLGKFSWPDTK